MAPLTCDQFDALVACGSTRISPGDAPTVIARYLLRLIELEEAEAGDSAAAADENIPIPLVEFGFASIGATYAIAFTDTHDKKVVSILNTTDRDLYLSWDGVTDHEIIRTGDSLKFNVGVFDSPVYLRSTTDAPTFGTAYISGYYGSLTDTVTSLALVEFDWSSVSGAYAVALNDTHDKRVVSILNTTDVDIYMSWDGVSNYEFLRSGDSVKFEIGIFNVPVYLKAVSLNPSIGKIYISGYY